MLIIKIHVDEYEKEDPSTRALSPRGIDESTYIKINKRVLLIKLRDSLKTWRNIFGDHNCQSNGF